MSASPIRTVLFDLDGTLVDHFETIYRCYTHALAGLGLEPRSYEHVKSIVGGGIRVTFGRLVPAEFVDRGVELWSERFEQIWDEGLVVLPGVEDLLDRLRDAGVTAGMLTNKEGVVARRISAKLGWDDRLAAVFGRLDTEWTKPAPELTRVVLAELGADAASSIMIGDSPFDVETAVNAGMRAHAVATGSHDEESLRETAACGVYPDLVALARDLWGWELEAEREAAAKA